MSEPEDVIAEGALHATQLARTLWARRRAGTAEQRPGLPELRRRLEFFIAATFPGAPPIGTAEPPAPQSYLSLLSRYRTAHLHSPVALPSVDGERIRLPGRLDTLPSSGIADRYRILALEQAARSERGTRAHIPAGDALSRDLYLLAEAAAIDAGLVAMFPRLATVLTEARRDAAASRPVARRRSPQEAEIERLVLGLLEAAPGMPPPPFVVTATPAISRQWAEGQRRALAIMKGPYRGMAPVVLWGALVEAPDREASGTMGEVEEAETAPGRSRTLERRPRSREASPDEDDAESGTWMIRADDLQEKAEDPAGLQRPADRDQDADTGDLAEALSELPELRLVRRPGPVAEVLASENPIPRVAARPAAGKSPSGIAYPEWDWRSGSYRPHAAIVRERVAEPGTEAWVSDAQRRHGAMIRAVRRDFERLRPRRMALRRQRDGAELDVDAMVEAYADQRRGGLADDRYYLDTRPRRRDVAIAVLLDASASTDAWIAADRRIIDVEKEALLVVAEALASLGDPHAILAFASAGPSRVTVSVLKRFAEAAASSAVRRRISGLEPGGYTRAGAVLRHVTAELARQPARHRLLLLLSDGRPNDVDEYEGRYGIEDTRMAVEEARLQGVYTYCLTVDRQAPDYATRIFGRDFAVLSRAERLPRVLSGLVRDLIRG